MSDTPTVDNIVPFKKRRRALTARAAIKFMREAGGDDGVLEVASIAELGRLLGWDKSRIHKAVDRWTNAGRVETEVTDGGRIRVRVPPDRRDLERGKNGGISTSNKRGKPRGKAGGKSRVEEVDIVSNPPAGSDTYLSTEIAGSAPPSAPVQKQISTPSARASEREISTSESRFSWRRRGGNGNGNFPVADRQPMTLNDVAAYAIAFALAGSAAYFSVGGMVVLFPGGGFAIRVMACAMEAAKLVVAGWLAGSGRKSFWLWRVILVGFVFGLMSINAVGLYSQLVAAHVGHHSAIVASNEADDARIAAQIELAESRLANVKERLAQLDEIVEGAAKKGKANTAEAKRQEQKKDRAKLAEDQETVAKELAHLKTARAAGAARGHAAEAEAAPIQYVAELFGIHRGGEEVIRWMIAAMVLCCDPLAVVLAAALGGRHRRRAA